MKIFLDSADINEILEISNLQIIDGLTTNPSLISKTAINPLELTRKICAIVDGDISIEVIGSDYETMIKEGDRISQISSKIVIKLPITWDGIRACKYFRSKNIKVNMTLCFSSPQALLAAKAGATYVSPFIGRLDDISSDGMHLIKDIKTIFNNYPQLETEILAASIRHTKHFYEATLLGCDAITMPGSLIKKLIHHPLTDKGLEIFRNDWDKSGLKI